MSAQHPNEVATKFSKRIDTYFFPVGDRFEEIVLDWLRHLKAELLFGGDDPLFPKTAVGRDDDDCFAADGLKREFWSGAEPVRKVFRAAFECAGLQNYTPHSFRRTLVRLAYQRKLTPGDLRGILSS